ncbi:MAG: reverse transcriptase domain-containing protein [Patescibacteria group bacterium]
MANLFLAWREFRRGKRQKPDVQAFEFDLEDNLFELHEQLVSKTYSHQPYESFFVTDPKLRHIHKATVRDRVLHQAVFHVLYPIFDHTFIYDSYSCRIGKGTHIAVNRLKEFCRKASCNNSRNIFALKCDIRKFFDSVDHEILIDLIKQSVVDPDVLWLIKLILDSFPKGLPLGNVTSQLFANIYLNELDQFAKHTLKAKYYLRYCDDFVLLNPDQSTLLVIRNFLENNLKLQLHPNKIILRTYRQGIDFLGYVVRPYCRTLRTKTKKRIFKNISEKNLASYLGVLDHCDGYAIRQKLFDLV